MTMSQMTRETLSACMRTYGKLACTRDVTLPNVFPIKENFTDRLRNNPFLIWLLTTSWHFKYVATIPCNLSFMACFAEINVSQSSVATYETSVQPKQWLKMTEGMFSHEATNRAYYKLAPQ